MPRASSDANSTCCESYSAASANSWSSSAGIAGFSGVRSATMTPSTIVTGFTGCASKANVGDGVNTSPVVVVMPSSRTTVNVDFCGSGTVGTIATVLIGIGALQSTAKNRSVIVGMTTVGTTV